MARYQKPVLGRSLLQLATSAGAFLVVCVAMHLLAADSYWLALPLMPLAAGLLVRVFIVQHDCGHGSFFRSRRLNDVVGSACSLITLTPYAAWRRQHAGHHGVWNNLDRRDSGVDIYSSCLTVEEYRALSPWRRRWYRASRSPLVANLLLPPLIFLVLYRFPFDMPEGWHRERLAVHATNLALLVVLVTGGALVGFVQMATVQLPVLALGAIVGVWLFTVQHRSATTTWAREDDWSSIDASLNGTNYLKLPAVLQWFTGNIGLHHVHHLNPRVPNYSLQACHDGVPGLRDVPAMGLGTALGAVRYVLWDERRRRMVPFRSAGIA